jgi:hypothetical protein
LRGVKNKTPSRGESEEAFPRSNSVSQNSVSISDNLWIKNPVIVGLLCVLYDLCG